MSIPDQVTVREHDSVGPHDLDVALLLHFASGAAVEVALTAEQKEQLLALARAEGRWPPSVALVSVKQPSGCGVMLVYDRRALGE